MNNSISKQILVTGGAGYIGSALVPRLLAEGYQVKVLDLYLFNDHSLASVAEHPGLTQIRGDLRDRQLLDSVLPGCDAVIHLACVSNDIGVEFGPPVIKSINYDAFHGLVDSSRDSGVTRFIYASSSSVYGDMHDDDVTENLELKPLNDFSKYKALCENVLLAKRRPGFTTLILRPAIVCGYSARLRLDLAVNALTTRAMANRLVEVCGNDQRRPNIHIADLCECLVQSLQWSSEKINGKIFNVGGQNHTLREIAEMIRNAVGQDVQVSPESTDDVRSCPISSERIQRELGFEPKHTVADAIQTLIEAFQDGKIPNSMTDQRYYNVKALQGKKLEELQRLYPSNVIGRGPTFLHRNSRRPAKL